MGKMTDEERRFKRREYAKRRYRANPEKVKNYLKKWRANNNERVAEYKKRLNEKNVMRNTIYSKRWNASNKEKCKESHRRCNEDIKHLVFCYYGSKCNYPNCTETDIDVMDLHHSDLDGAKHRKDHGDSNLWRFVAKNKFPSNIIMLCANHHRKVHATARKEEI